MCDCGKTRQRVRKKSIFMKWSAYIAFFVMLSSVVCVGCKKNIANESSHTRLTPEFRKQLDKVGMLHNNGITRVRIEHPQWFSNITDKFNKPSFNSGVIRGNSIDYKPNNEPGGFEEIDALLRSYYRQYTLDSFPEFGFTLVGLLDSINTITPSFYYTDPDSLLVERIINESPVAISSYCVYLLGELFNEIEENNNYSEFCIAVESLVINAEANLTNNNEFYAYATAVAVAKKSFQYWVDENNLSYWNDLIASVQTAGQVSGQSIKYKKYNIPEETHNVVKVVGADAAGAFRGGLLGGLFGSIGGPAGSFAGVLGGALFTGLGSSTVAALRIVVRNQWGW